MSNTLPNALIRKLGNDPFFDKEAFLAAHQAGDQLTSIRINPEKPSELLFPLSDAVPWCASGFYLPERPVFTLDPLFHAGCYYVQEASSMFIAHIVKELALDQAPIRALDCCAAPGGKSTLLNSLLSKESLLVANEIIKSRSVILQENHVRWGAANVVVTNNDPSAFKRLPGFFDLILVDAPCSGSGMFRKDENSIDNWSEAAVKLCYERQQRILSQTIGSLSTEGYLLYSTCSYSQEENESLVDWLMDEYALETVAIPLDPLWKIQETRSAKHQGHGYRFYPHQTKGEGFFISVLRSTAVRPSFSVKKLKMEKQPVPVDALENWVQDYKRYKTLMHNGNVHFFPAEMEVYFKALQQVLYLKNAGTIAGKWLGTELVPAHDLAMSVDQDQGLPAVELDLERARQFLRKKPLDPEQFSVIKKGWCLVKFSGVSLGWVKVLANRVNNYYPKDVRIAHL
ncbi:MAG: methyltransferase RsmF C-terminal domain-like protein [Sphingobacterium sp.]